MMPKAGSSAPATRNPSEAETNGPGTRTKNSSTTNAATRPPKLHGSASRVAARNGSSENRAMRAKRLEAADDGFDAAEFIQKVKALLETPALLFVEQP